MSNWWYSVMDHNVDRFLGPQTCKTPYITCKYMISVIIHLFCLWKTEHNEPSRKWSPIWKYLPNWELVIQQHLLPSIHSQCPRCVKISVLYVNTLWLHKYTIVTVKKSSPGSPAAKDQAGNSGKAKLMASSQNGKSAQRHPKLRARIHPFPSPNIQNNGRIHFCLCTRLQIHIYPPKWARTGMKSLWRMLQILWYWRHWTNPDDISLK